MLIQYRCLSIPFQIFYATYQPQNAHDFLSFWLNAIVKFDLLSGQKGPYQQEKQGGSGTTSLAWKYIKVCGYSDLFAKTWTKGHWPLDDLWSHICWGLMCESTQGSLCPSPMKIHQSMWIQWPFLQKTWTKGHWPLDDLWPHICRGHMCDSTQGSLCPSPMGIHQCMWIQWWIQ